MRAFTVIRPITAQSAAWHMAIPVPLDVWIPSAPIPGMVTNAERLLEQSKNPCFPASDARPAFTRNRSSQAPGLVPAIRDWNTGAALTARPFFVRSIYPHTAWDRIFIGARPGFSLNPGLPFYSSPETEILFYLAGFIVARWLINRFNFRWYDYLWLKKRMFRIQYKKL